jgi:hypothetical protein
LTRADTIVSQPGSASQSHARVALDVHPGPLSSTAKMQFGRRSSQPEVDGSAPS